MSRLKTLYVYEKLSSLMAEYPRAIFANVDNETLLLKYATLPDVGTLPNTLEISHKYLKIQDGDIVLTNDPYSGGSVLSSPTLIMGVGLRSVKGQTPAEFLIGSRVTLFPRIGPFKTIDEEGLRIPPSPLYQRGEPNTPIFDALKGHPQIPADFISRVENEAAKLLKTRELLKSWLASGNLVLGKPEQKAFLQHSQNEFVRRLENFGEGRGTAEIEIGPQEFVRLSAEIHESHLTFDFAGTSPGQRVFITDTAAAGAVISTVVSLLAGEIPINSGVFSRFDIRTPRGSLVNSAFPRPAFIGHTDGLNVIANCVASALSQVDKNFGWAHSGPSHVAYELAFRDGRVFLDGMPVGTGATVKSKGCDAVSVWRRVNMHASIEFYETHFPMQFLMAGMRNNSEGSGKFKGGQGAAKTIRLDEDAELSWNFISPPHKPEGLAGGKSALGPELILQRATGEKVELVDTGRMEVKRNDVITILSPGGGGYGEE